MKTVMILFLLGVQEAATVIHSLKFFSTVSSEVPNFPEFVVVGMVDDVQVARYDSHTQKAEPTQEWMLKLTEDHPQIWEDQTAGALGRQQQFKANFESVKQLFNHTGGVHTYQEMSGCDWDNETNELIGFVQFGYDGEDFISFDQKTETWIASNQQAVIIKNNWDNNKALTAQVKTFFSQIFPELLKNLLNYGRSSLMRTVLPSVSLLQRSSSSPITCHSTGFYPHRAELVWKKDREELLEGVHKGEILPNHDGTFQMSADLNLSAVGSEDWHRYSCVFQLSGVNQEITTNLDKAGIRSNEGGSPPSMSIPVVVAVVLAVVFFAAVAVISFIIYKKRTDKRPPSPLLNPEVQEQMLPTA